MANAKAAAGGSDVKGAVTSSVTDRVEGCDIAATLPLGLVSRWARSCEHPDPHNPRRPVFFAVDGSSAKDAALRVTLRDPVLELVGAHAPEVSPNPCTHKEPPEGGSA